VTGAVEEFTTDPATVTFAGLAIMFSLGAAATWTLLAGVAVREAGTLRSVLPSISVPAKARREFRAGLPMAAATWAVGGLYLGLGPTIMQAAFHLNGEGCGGLAIAVLSGIGAVTPLLPGSAAPRDGVPDPGSWHWRPLRPSCGLTKASPTARSMSIPRQLCRLRRPERDRPVRFGQLGPPCSPCPAVRYRIGKR
jgi:hypothetical protein